MRIKGIRVWYGSVVALAGGVVIALGVLLLVGDVPASHPHGPYSQTEYVFGLLGGVASGSLLALALFVLLTGPSGPSDG